MSSPQTIYNPELAQGDASPLSVTDSVKAQPQHRPEAAASLEKVRELLFGQQVRSSEQQFQALEKELVTLKSDVETRLTCLEDIVNKGFTSITQQLQMEREERKAAIAGTEQSIAEIGDDVDQKSAQLEQRIGSEVQTLQQKILDASHQFTTLLQQKSEDFSRDLNQASQQYQQQKQAHKSRLSALFNELSECLNDE